MRPLDPEKPIRYADRNRSISPDMVQVFFNSFAPEEKKYKLIFAVQISTGLRIGEVLPMNLLDFLYTDKYSTWQPEDIHDLGNDFQRLYMFMDDLKELDFTKCKVLLGKKLKENCIVDMNIPVSVSSLLKEWIFKNLKWIIRQEGYIFPKNNKKRPFHLSYTHVGDFISKKRKYLHQLYPDMGFMDAVSTVHYKELNGLTRTQNHKLYRFSTHSFRKFHALYGYKFHEKDSLFAKQLLHHCKISTTEQHYLAHFDFEDKRKKFQDHVFNDKFHNLLREENSQAVAVWAKAREY